MHRKDFITTALILLISLTIRGQAKERILLHHINTKGYSVRVVYRDVNGILWLGTTSGLLSLPQLQSNNPRGYHRNPNNMNMSIKHISGDNHGCLWIKTLYNDNYFYDPQHGKIVEFTPEILSQNGISDNRDFTVLTDTKDNHWIWKDNCLYWFKNTMTKVSEIKITPYDRIRNVIPEGKHLIALAEKSLYRISTEKQKIIQTIPLPAGYNMRDHLFISNDGTPWIWALGNLWRNDGTQWIIAFKSFTDITGIAQDNEGRLWVATQSDGIYICNNQGVVINHLQRTENIYGLLSNRVESVFFEPVSQSMWITYTKGGLSTYSQTDEDLLLRDITDTSDSEAVTDVLAFAPAKAHNGMWIGLEERGVWLHAPHGDHCVIDGGSAVSLYTDHDNNLWAGIYRHGLIRRSPDGQQRLYLTGASPFAIAEDEQGNIFVATLGMGVSQIDPVSGEATDTHLKPKYVFDLKCHQHKLYAASTEGLFVRDSRLSQWKLLLDGHFRHLCIDQQGYIWLIGNEGSEGMTLLGPSGNPIDLPDNLKTAPLKSIITDKDGNVWATTPSELLMLRYRPKEEKTLEQYSFKVDDEEGLQVIYNPHTPFIDEAGFIWLGATNGYQTINTYRLVSRTKGNSSARPLILGAVSINDNVLSPGERFNGRTLLDKDIAYIRHLNLQYNENNLLIECSQPCDKEYVSDIFYYQLKGLSDAWHPIEGHSIILSNLPPGSYQLLTRTQATEAYTLLTIHIARPYWLSWWAFCIYALLTIAAIYGLLRYYRNRRAYQLQLRELQLQQEQQTQINEMKLRFFTNISHDLRTPLSLIIGPVEELMHSKHDEWPSLDMIHRNALHLLSLVNQILDFRRLEFGKEKFLPSYGDIVSLLNDICNSFRLKAEKEQIQFSFVPCIERLETTFDHDKTRKIMMNLLSNAFKFTNAGGSITVRLEISDEQIAISVADTGIGIPDPDKEHLFDRFYQSDQSNRTSMGSGIGLHIVREYVHLQGGEVTVADNIPEGRGSIFCFTLPRMKIGEINEDLEEESNISTSQPSLPLILLVDDNHDLLSYMSQSLSDSYQILMADNGVEALRLLEGHDVDIIISDVMMPEMDGLELCRCIKTDFKTSHIPVILLTAKTMTSDELKGLEAGADDYITKPFSMDVLRQRIHNLIERSHHQHERFTKEIDIEPSEITVTSLDEQFIARAVSIVETHIADPDFSIEQLSEEIGVHRAQLYKKLQHLTGKSPQQFVRILRLKRGKRLLEQSGLYVSEVAYKVGFNSPRIFSKYFKEEFGITPKDFSKQE